MIPLILCGIIVVWILYIKYKEYHKTDPITQKEKRKEEKEIKEEKKKVKSSSSSSGGNSFWAIVIVLILVGVVWGILYNNQHKQVATTKIKQPALMLQRGILTWHKPEGVAGIKPDLRVLSKSVVINRNDEKIMEFTTEGGTYFYWDKKNKYGVWNGRGACGHWFLYVDEGDQKFFSGKEFDDQWQGIELYLELI